jgi:serine/threonine protein kinase
VSEANKQFRIFRLQEKLKGVLPEFWFIVVVGLLSGLLALFALLAIGPHGAFTQNNIINILGSLDDKLFLFFLAVFAIACLPQRFANYLRRPLVLKFLCAAVALAVLSELCRIPSWLVPNQSVAASGGLSAIPSILLAIAALFLTLMCSCTAIAISANRILKELDSAGASRNRSGWCRGALKLIPLEFTHSVLLAAYTVFVCTFVCYPGGVGDWLGGWLLSSGRDCNIYAPGQSLSYREALDTSGASPDHRGVFYQTTASAGVRVAPMLPPGSQVVKANLTLPVNLGLMVKILFSILLLAFSLPVVHRVVQVLTLFVQRFSVRPELTRISEAFVDATRTRWSRLELPSEHPFLSNAARTFWWFIACYLLIFLGITLAPGEIGMSIMNWLDASLIDAGFHNIGTLEIPQLRAFMAALIAMYGAVPVAVTLCVFLPHRKPEELSLCSEALLLPGGLRRLRDWSDVERVELTGAANKPSGKRRLHVKFRSGGAFTRSVSSIEPAHLNRLLTGIDEYADDCLFSPAALELRQELGTYDSGSVDKLERPKQAGKFSSTIFAPLTGGQCIRGGVIRIVRQLCSKSLTATYLVRLDKQLAVLKQFVLPADTEQNKLLRTKFVREYELLKSLDHPCISRVLDVFNEGDSTFLLIEHARGKDLSTLVRELGPRSEDTVIEWAEQICRILEYLHKREPPIIHRDLTPDNVVICDNGQIRIVDFGAAQQFMEGVTGTLIGKQCYVAPEQLRGQASGRSDIYSLGCTLYYLLTGKDPLPLSECDPREVGKTSPWLAELIRACTAFEESERPQSVEVVMQILSSRGKSGTPIPALLPSSPAGAQTADGGSGSTAEPEQHEANSLEVIDLKERELKEELITRNE